MTKKHISKKISVKKLKRISNDQRSRYDAKFGRKEENKKSKIEGKKRK